jgi:hypothetical protein
MKFYKATRMDGTSFYDNKTKWVVGGVVEVPEHDSPSCCNGSVIHASTEPAETLVGGEWPCRLFVVEGEPVAEKGHKRGFFQIKVVEEIEAWKALGPNGQEVAALIEKAGTITLDLIERLAAARAAARPAVRAAARSAARSAARAAAGNAAVNAARYAAAYAAVNAAWDATWAAAWAAAWDATWAAAWAAARDAVLALTVKDLISPADFNALFAPWKEVMESD